MTDDEGHSERQSGSFRAWPAKQPAQLVLSAPLVEQTSLLSQPAPLSELTSSSQTSPPPRWASQQQYTEVHLNAEALAKASPRREKGEEIGQTPCLFCASCTDP